MEKTVRRIDAFQQRHTAPGFVFGVSKKFGDDNGGSLVVQLTYAFFTTVFPLLLLLVTILGIVLAGNAAARNDVLNSTFGQFPIVGKSLSQNVHALKRSSAFGLVVGLLGLLYGTTGLAGTGLYVMAQVWNLPNAVRPNYITRMARSLIFLAVLAVGLIVTTFLSSFGTFGRHNFWLGVAAEVVAAFVNVGLYASAFRVLTPKQVATTCLMPGVILAGIVWTILQALGGYVVGHDLKGASATYGLFGLVLGLLAWIYIGAEVTVYAAELNTVLARRLWPRGMVQPPLTKADQESIALQAIESQRRPEQEIITNVRVAPMTQDEYREAGYQVEPTVGTTKRVPEE
ncbi:MAG: putative ribonuclease [Acidimicrobiaceae bacterium]|nr:putative ribonuclease [Acidimicrobiaceae bacterium]